LHGVNNMSLNGARGPFSRALTNNWVTRPKPRKHWKTLTLPGPDCNKNGVRAFSNSMLHGLIFRFILI